MLPYKACDNSSNKNTDDKLPAHKDIPEFSHIEIVDLV